MYYSRESEFLENVKKKAKKCKRAKNVLYFFAIFFAILCILDSLYAYCALHVSPIHSSATQYFFYSIIFTLFGKDFAAQYNFLTFKQEQQIYCKKKYIYKAQTLDRSLVIFGLCITGFVIIVLIHTVPNLTNGLSYESKELLIAAIAIGLLLPILFIPWLNTNIKVHKHLKQLYACGTKYPAQIIGCEAKIASYLHTNRLFKKEGFTGVHYLLVIKFELDERILLIRTPALCDHPNSILKSPNCNIYIYNDSFLVGDFDLRIKKEDKHLNIPTSHSDGAAQYTTMKEEFIHATINNHRISGYDNIYYLLN